MVGRRAEDLAAKQNAVAALYETHFERVARYIAVRIGSIDEAEDLASEVFVRALRSVGSYKETGAPMEAWIFKIAHNIFVDYLRKRSRRPEPLPLDDPSPLAVDEASSMAGIYNPNPTENLERQQEVQQLHRALEQLSEAQRRVLALRFGAELTSEQTAQVLGKKPGAVREMQSAAIKKLRQIMERSEAGTA